MKTIKYFLGLSAAVFATVLLTCCSDNNDDVIWDIAPVEYEITLVDEYGNNLLDENRTDNLIGTDIYVIFEGEKYEANWEPPYTVNSGRYLMPTFYGFQAWQYYKREGNDWTAIPGQYSLIFGEFFGDQDQNLSIELIIPGQEKTYKIDLIHKFKWVHNNPESSTYLKYDGKEIDGWRIELVVPMSAE